MKPYIRLALFTRSDYATYENAAIDSLYGFEIREDGNLLSLWTAPGNDTKAFWRRVNYYKLFPAGMLQEMEQNA